MKLYEPVELAGGFHGSHLVANMNGKSGTVTFNQIAVFDQATSKVYAISIYCTDRVLRQVRVQDQHGHRLMDGEGQLT